MQHEIEAPESPRAFRFAILFSVCTAISSDGTLYDDVLSRFGPYETELFGNLITSCKYGHRFEVDTNSAAQDKSVQSLLDIAIPTFQVGFDYNFIFPEQFTALVEEGDPHTLPRVYVPALIKERIKIPVIHIIGKRDDPLLKTQSEAMKGLCLPKLLYCIQHQEGHDIPRGSEVDEIVKGIEWATDISLRNPW